MTAKQMIEKRELAKKRVVQAIKKAEKIGAKIVGLGALTSSITGGGEEIKDKIDIKITPGHAYTTFTVSSYVLRAANDFFPGRNPTIGIVGAAGSIGSYCAQRLASKGLKKFILIDLERKNHHLENLLEKLKDINSNIEISSSHKINDIKDADIIIAATNAPEALITPDDLKSGAIIIDDAQPSDISEEVMKQRNDVLVVDGGVVLTLDINAHFNLGLARKNDIFCCLGETLIMACDAPTNDYCLKGADISLINQFGELGELLGFRIDNYQRSGKVYAPEKINEIKKIITEKLHNC